MFPFILFSLIAGIIAIAGYRYFAERQPEYPNGRVLTAFALWGGRHALMSKRGLGGGGGRCGKRAADAAMGIGWRYACMRLIGCVISDDFGSDCVAQSRITPFQAAFKS